MFPFAAHQRVPELPSLPEATGLLVSALEAVAGLPCARLFPGSGVGVDVGAIAVGVSVGMMAPSAVMLTEPELNPLELAVSVIVPLAPVDCTITKHFPLKARRDEAL